MVARPVSGIRESGEGSAGNRRAASNKKISGYPWNNGGQFSKMICYEITTCSGMSGSGLLYNGRAHGIQLMLFCIN
jgi:hypothetical protein